MGYWVGGRGGHAPEHYVRALCCNTAGLFQICSTRDCIASTNSNMWQSLPPYLFWVIGVSRVWDSMRIMFKHQLAVYIPASCLTMFSLGGEIENTKICLLTHSSRILFTICWFSWKLAHPHINIAMNTNSSFPGGGVPDGGNYVGEVGGTPEHYVCASCCNMAGPSQICFLQVWNMFAGKKLSTLFLPHYCSQLIACIFQVRGIVVF